MMNGGVDQPRVIDFKPESIIPSVSVELKSAEINKQGRLEVIINNQTLEYPVDWLKRSCLCKECFNPYCQSHTNSLKKIIQAGATLSSVTATKDGSVKCTYSDGHSGEFPAEWLYKHRMTPEGHKERSAAIFLHQTKAWPDPEEMKVQKCSWEKVTETEEGFEMFAEGLIQDGIFVITDLPVEDAHKKFEEKTGLAPISNHYGVDWVVEHTPSPTNHAYTSIDLDLHIDQAFLLRSPQIQVLQCIKQSDIGGENVMSDSIKAAKVLRERQPEYFKILSTIKIQQEDVISHTNKQQFYMANISPTIILDEAGEPATVHLNHAAQSNFFPGTVDEYERYSEALKMFYDILYEYSITIKSSPGDALVFDNERVLHGRRSYDPSFHRKLHGWYIDWDTLHSKLRVCKIQKALKAAKA